MLFGRKKKKDAPALTISVPYSASYKGYKKLKLKTYSDPQVDLDEIRAMPDPDAIIFEEHLFPGASPLLRVYANGVKLGTLWKNELNAEYFDHILNGRCTRVSLGTNATNVFIFLKV